jgi:hypothetical protein
MVERHATSSTDWAGGGEPIFLDAPQEIIRLLFNLLQDDPTPWPMAFTAPP